MAMQLLKFGAGWCAPCKAMARAKTLEKFSQKHPAVKVRLVDLDSDEEPKGRAALALAAEAEKLEGRYEIQAFPTLIFTDSSGEELARADTALDLGQLEALYETAKKAAIGNGENENDTDEND